MTSKFTSELRSEKDKNEKLESSFNQLKQSVDNKKLLAIGISILNSLAKPTDLADLNVIADIETETFSEEV